MAARATMNRVDEAFRNKPIFMPYFPLGYPDLETSIAVIETLAKNGADLIEVGLSFSDPLADGPVNQKAMQRALENGITIAKSLDAVAELRQRGVEIPLVLMGYYNPILAFGLEKFICGAESAGADGFIIPDLPIEESEEFVRASHVCQDRQLLGDSPLPLIRMLAPTTPSRRMKMIADSARGFIYLVSVTGVTGARKSLSEGLADLVERVREHTSIPVCIGFGIGTPQQAKEVGAISDGVIIGSACVREIGESEQPVGTAQKFARSYNAVLQELKH